MGFRSNSKSFTMWSLTIPRHHYLLINIKMCMGKNSQTMYMKLSWIRVIRLKLEVMLTLNAQGVSSRATINFPRVEAFLRFLITITLCSVISRLKSPRRSSQRKEPKSWWTLAKLGILRFTYQTKSPLRVLAFSPTISRPIITSVTRPSHSPYSTMIWPSKAAFWRVT